MLPWQLILYNPSVKKKKKTVWRCGTFLLPDWFTYCIGLTGKAVNQLPIILAIFDNYCHGVFPFIQPCWAKWVHNAIDKLSKVKDLIFFFFFYSGRNSINFELRSLTLSSTSKEVNTLFLSRIICLLPYIILGCVLGIITASL